MTEREQRHGLIGSDVADYRDLPSEIFTEPLSHLEKMHRTDFGKPLTLSQREAFSQGLALSIGADKDPFSPKSQKGAIKVFGISHSRENIEKVVEALFSEDRIENPNFIVQNIKEAVSAAKEKYNILKDVEKTIRSTRPHGIEVPGDPEATDPKRGTKGVHGWRSPEDPKTTQDNQSLHFGPGYDS